MNYFIGIFIIVIGISAIYAGRKVNKTARKIKKFLFKQPDTLSVDIIGAKTCHNMREPYTLASAYTFMVNDKIYEGKTSFDINLSGAEKAFYKSDAEKQKNMIEESNKVWYNPEDPAENFLSKTNLGPFALVPVLGYIMCSIGLICILTAIFN
jgi:hypothetical protein